MQRPSKRQVKAEELIRARERLIAALCNPGSDDADGQILVGQLRGVVAELAEVEQGPDVYTCLQCGADFEHGPHVELCVASVTVFGEGPDDYRHLDYSVKTPRRFKFCLKCSAGWVHQPLEYAELR
jgi:hypothetical protein